MKNFVGQA